MLTKSGRVINKGAKIRASRNEKKIKLVESSWEEAEKRAMLVGIVKSLFRKVCIYLFDTNNLIWTTPVF